MVTLAEFVADTMESSRLSAYDVQERSGNTIHQTSVHRIRKGIIANPEPETLRNLSLGLGVPHATLMSIVYAPDDDANDLTTMAIVDYCGSLPESVREDVLVIVKALFEKHRK